MRPTLKRTILHILKGCGAFTLARRATADGLRILCYHGISLADEHDFHGQLFMRPSTFERRMRILETQGYHVVSLSRAMSDLASATLSPGSVVITIDDGWLGTYEKAVPVLLQLDYPATIYVATLHASEQTPVTDVLLPYVLWLGRGNRLDLSKLNIGLSGMVDLDSAERRKAVAAQILSGCPRNQPMVTAGVIRRVAELVNVDYSRIERLRLMRLMTLEQLRDSSARGLDIQLHTHSHAFSKDDFAMARHEIERNREILQPVTVAPLVHFCYPSGQYDATQFPVLNALGIETATTCQPGFNYLGTHPMELGRFLDGEDIADIEFEAELSGMLEILRGARRRLSRVLHGGEHQRSGIT
jgi:peptidoglycan/xylan/chitin deacetylase (PgdA/CDA1 family)